EIKFYEGYTSLEKTSLVGYAFVSAGRGYSSTIETMVGVDTSGAIIGIRVLRQVETPGLGTRVEEIKYGESDSWFQRQFLRKNAEVINVDKDGGDIQSITGATISSRAVTRSIVSGFKDLKAQLSPQQ
ncbi:MAG: FMN-binding protein, partial [Calditrichaeota bacterium]